MNINNIKKFYEEKGWEKIDEHYYDTILHEDLRKCSKKYISKCRNRILKYIPSQGQNILDMASGAIPYEEYLNYSNNFKKRYCCDLSLKALREAKKKLGNKAEILHGNFLELNIKENFFDCSISLHTIYHFDKNDQEKAVRKLVEVTKKGGKIIIIYSNPITIIDKIRNLIKFKNSENRKSNKNINLYYHYYPINWWKKFSDSCSIQIYPNRSLSSWHLQKFIPNNYIGIILLNFLFFLEELFPNFFVKNFQYPTIIMEKLGD